MVDKTLRSDGSEPSSARAFGVAGTVGALATVLVGRQAARSGAPLYHSLLLRRRWRGLLLRLQEFAIVTNVCMKKLLLLLRLNTLAHY